MVCPSCGADAGDISKFCPACGTSIVRVVDGEDYVGRIVDKKYRVEELIGEGGMGKVYRARQLVLDKPVVLKVLRQSLLSDERTVARFQREAKAASRLNHPNSISILDFGQAEDAALYIAMEYVQGKDLHQILSREWPLPESRVVRIVGQVLSALSDAHGAGVIHRDLKPENIMVEQRRGEPDFVKVLDFGIAKIQDSTGDEGPALTRAGFVCGTPEYMSPEQARGGMLDARSDLYAVGVILYQLTTGLLPFESDSAVGYATKHLTVEPPPPSKRRPEARISPPLERLIMKALAKDPNDRPQAAEEFRDELFALDKERRGTARRPPSSPPVLGPLPRMSTPADQAETRVNPPEPPWGSSAEKTVRADPPDVTASVSGPRPVPLRPVPTRPGAPRIVPSRTGGEGSLLAFKVLTVLLVTLSVGLVGWYLYTVYATPSVDPESYVDAPKPVVDPAQAAPAEPVVADVPLYAQEPAASSREPEVARRLALEGDQARSINRLDLATRRYQEAFEKDPDPEYSLKLGEVNYQRDEREAARGWWDRHLRDKPDSRARTYIEERLTER
ncbi:MAG: protein kinase [Myxococcaceae bacterium]